jgi:hypothetical protein
MTSGTVFAITFAALALYAVFIAYWMLAGSLCPEWTDRAAERYRRPWRTTLIGALAAFPILLIGDGLAKAGLGGVAAAFFLAVILMGLFGSCGLVKRIGAGMKSASDENEPWRQLRRGGLVLGFTFVAPILGWFVVLPWTLISGLGAFILARPRRSTTPAPAIAESTAAVL